MRNLLLSVALVYGLMLPVGAAHPQSAATVTELTVLKSALIPKSANSITSSDHVRTASAA